MGLVRKQEKALLPLTRLICIQSGSAIQCIQIKSRLQLTDIGIAGISTYMRNQRVEWGYSFDLIAAFCYVKTYIQSDILQTMPLSIFEPKKKQVK